MNIYWKIAVGILTALILWINLSRSNKDLAVLISLAICAMSGIAGIAFLQPIVEFIKKLQHVGNLDSELVAVVLKVVGIGMISEISALICKDAGNESLGKTLQFVSAATVLWISIPVFDKLIALLDRILGDL